MNKMNRFFLSYFTVLAVVLLLISLPVWSQIGTDGKGGGGRRGTSIPSRDIPLETIEEDEPIDPGAFGPQIPMATATLDYRTLESITVPAAAFMKNNSQLTECAVQNAGSITYAGTDAAGCEAHIPVSLPQGTKLAAVEIDYRVGERAGGSLASPVVAAVYRANVSSGNNLQVSSVKGATATVGKGTLVFDLFSSTNLATTEDGILKSAAEAFDPTTPPADPVEDSIILPKKNSFYAAVYLRAGGFVKGATLYYYGE